MDWDRKHIHFCIESYQSAQDVQMACGIELSTWAAHDLPWKQSGNEFGTEPSPEKDLGYSFSSQAITCPECIEWMKNHLPKCKDCGCLTPYSYCNTCAAKRMFELQRNIDGQWIKIEHRAMLFATTIEDARKIAEELDVGKKPEAIRIVDYTGKVCGWVSKNGYKPGGALAP